MKIGSKTAMLLSTLLLLGSLVTVAALKAPSRTASASSANPTSSASAAVSSATPSAGTASSGAVAPDYAKAKALVEQNRVFGDLLYDEDALLDGVEILLLDSSVEQDGFRYLDKATAMAKVKAMYGRDLSETAGTAWALDAPDGYYPILPCGYDRMEHTVTSVTEQADGTLHVISLVVIESPAETTLAEALTVLSPAENEYGYIITAATLAE